MKSQGMNRKGYRKTRHVKVSRNVVDKRGRVKVDGAKMGIKVRVGLDVVWCGVGGRGDQIEKGSENEGSGNGQKRVQKGLESEGE